VILEDDKSDTPDPEAAAVSVLIDAHFKPSTELWYNIEDKCFVDEDLRPIPPLEQRGLASTPISTPAQDQPHSVRHSPAKDKDGEGWSNDIAEFEKEVQRSLQGQEKGIVDWCS
jgi:hypothetical protein